jgi:hypothetical protein
MNKEKISQAQLRRRAQLKKHEPSIYARLLKKEKKMTIYLSEDEEGNLSPTCERAWCFVKISLREFVSDEDIKLIRKLGFSVRINKEEK